MAAPGSIFVECASSTTSAYKHTLEEYLACDESEPPAKRQRLEAQLNALGGLAAQFQAASVVHAQLPAFGTQVPPSGLRRLPQPTREQQPDHEQQCPVCMSDMTTAAAAQFERE